MDLLLQLHRNCIFTGAVDCYCLVCDMYLPSEDDPYTHIRTETHKENLHKVKHEETSAMEKYKKDQVYKVERGYYCVFCNLLLAKFKVDLHIKESCHMEKKWVQMLGRADNQIVAFDEVQIQSEAWHGFTENRCMICSLDIDDQQQHKMTHSHMLQLIQSKCEFGDNFIYRKVDEDCFFCIICGSTHSNSEKATHHQSVDHLNHYKAGKELRSQYLNSLKRKQEDDITLTPVVKKSLSSTSDPNITVTADNMSLSTDEVIDVNENSSVEVNNSAVEVTETNKTAPENQEINETETADKNDDVADNNDNELTEKPTNVVEVVAENSDAKVNNDENLVSSSELDETKTIDEISKLPNESIKSDSEEAVGYSADPTIVKSDEVVANNILEPVQETENNGTNTIDETASNTSETANRTETVTESADIEAAPVAHLRRSLKPIEPITGKRKFNDESIGSLNEIVVAQKPLDHNQTKEIEDFFDFFKTAPVNKFRYFSDNAAKQACFAKGLELQQCMIFDNFIIGQADKRMWCVLCDRYVDTKDVHISGKHHITLLFKHKKFLYDKFHGSLESNNPSAVEPALPVPIQNENAAYDAERATHKKSALQETKAIPAEKLQGAAKRKTKYNKALKKKALTDANINNNADIPCKKLENSKSAILLENVQKCQEHNIRVDFHKQTAYCEQCQLALGFDMALIDGHINECHEIKRDSLEVKDMKKTKALNLAAYAQENHMDVLENKAYCKLCNVSLILDLNEISGHVNFFTHRDKMIAKDNTGPMTKVNSKEFVKNFMCIESTLRTEIVVNDTYVMSYNSFHCVVDKGNILTCALCQEDVDLSTGDQPTLHMETARHKELLATCNVIKSLPEDFIREIRAGQYHCGYCNESFAGWTVTAAHVRSGRHAASRRAARWARERAAELRPLAVPVQVRSILDIQVI